MEAVAVVTALFFAATIVATRQVVGVSSPDDAVLMLVIGLRRFSEIIEVRETMLYGGADGAWPKRA